MADYYRLMAKAVAALEKGTVEARRALYDRARSALVAQLRGVTPALNESDITRERLSLEEGIPQGGDGSGAPRAHSPAAGAQSQGADRSRARGNTRLFAQSSRSGGEPDRSRARGNS